MLNTLTRYRFRGLVLGIALFAASNALATDSWVHFTPDGVIGIKEMTRSQAAQLDVVAADAKAITLAVRVPGFALGPRKTPFGEFVTVTWPDAEPSGEIGAPALPVMRRLFAVAPGADVALNWTLGATAVLDSDMAGIPLNIEPRQRPVPKTPGARESMPFDFDAAAYAVDADYLADPVTIEELGMVRGQRLFLVEVHPVAYNPVGQTITFRSEIDVDISISGGTPSDLSPMTGLDRVVLNPWRHDGSRGDGNYLLIVPASFETQIASFASAKATQGFTVNTHVVPDGTSNITIKTYIQSLWGGPTRRNTSCSSATTT